LRVEVRKSKSMGLGTYAVSKIRQGEFVRTLSGQELRYPELLKRLRSGEVNIDDPLQVEAHLFMILDEPSRLFNHSCDPTSGIRGKNTLVAIRDIKEDEEITFDYSATVGINNAWGMKCLCGSPRCRKVIGNVLSIPEDSLKYYIQNRALQDFIIKQLVDNGRIRFLPQDKEAGTTS